MLTQPAPWLLLFAADTVIEELVVLDKLRLLLLFHVNPDGALATENDLGEP